MNLLKKSAISLKNHIYNFSRDRADEQHRFLHAADYVQLDNLIGEYLTSLNFTTIAKKRKNQAYKLIQLKSLLEIYEPKNILEFGSGSSSVVIADYARKNNAKFTTVDESEDWANQARNFICKPGEDNITVVARNKLSDISQKPPAIHYEGNFDGEYDFVFIDGPSLTIDGKTVATAANTDVFMINPLPKIIAVDGRYATAMLIKERYQNKYKLKLSDLFTSIYIKPNYNYLSVFVRND